MLDALNRRSRRKRQPSKKRLQISERDLQIFSLLYRYRILSSQDLIAHIKPQSIKRFTERLGHLFHDGGVIERPNEQWALAGSHYAPNIYSLSPKGKRLLQNEDQLPLQAVVYPEKSQGGIRKQLLHSLKISQTISKVELETKQHTEQRFVPLQEIKNRQISKGKLFKLEFPITIPISEQNPHSVCRTTVRPDGLYGIEYTETGELLYRFFAVEVDISTPQNRMDLKNSSIRKKQLAYDAAIKSGSFKAALGLPNLAAHFIH